MQLKGFYTTVSIKLINCVKATPIITAAKLLSNENSFDSFTYTYANATHPVNPIPVIILKSKRPLIISKIPSKG